MSFKTERSPEFHQTLKWIITTVRIPVVLPQQPSGLPPGWPASPTQQSSYVLRLAEEGESQAVPLGSRFSGTPKDPETWAEPDATLVTFLSGFFSPTPRTLLPWSFPRCLSPVPSPSPVSPGFARLWTLTLPTTSFPSALSSWPLLPSTKLPHLVLHPGHSHAAPRKPIPPPPRTSPSAGCLLLFFLLYGAPTKRGELCQSRREPPCPWFCCGGGLSDEPFHRASLRAHAPSSRPCRGSAGTTALAARAGRSSEGTSDTHCRGNIWRTL